MKMYVCVLDSFPDHITPNLVGMSMLQHHIAYTNDEISPYLYKLWLETSRFTCVVKLTQHQLESIAHRPDAVSSREFNIRSKEPTCVTLVVDEFIPEVLKSAKCWKPDHALLKQKIRQLKTN